jgi:hypothetical protein
VLAGGDRNIAAAIVEQDDTGEGQSQAAAALVRQAVDASLLTLSAAERRWLDRIEAALAGLPPDAGELRERLAPTYGHLYDPASYGLE